MGAVETYEQLMERAFALARPVTRRPDPGVALPFGIDYPEAFRWRMSPDVRAAIIAGSTGFVGMSVMPEERLLGIRLVVDYKAPEDTLELLAVVD